MSAYVMQTAPAGLRRMRELRNCHIKGNFVTETALSIGAVETNTLSGALRRAVGCLSKSRNFFLSVQKEIRELICRNRLAVWRQLPKLILAGSTPVSCSKPK